MKTLLIIFLAVLTLPILAQKPEDSPINFSAGIGPNYGILGVKTVFGKNHTGFLVGLGFLGEHLAVNTGLQLGIKSF